MRLFLRSCFPSSISLISCRILIIASQKLSGEGDQIHSVCLDSDPLSGEENSPIDVPQTFGFSRFNLYEKNSLFSCKRQ